MNSAVSVFFFNDTATTEIYTLSLHDALPICCAAAFAACPTMRVMRRSRGSLGRVVRVRLAGRDEWEDREWGSRWSSRSEEHTSELQSRQYLVCRLALEKKNRKSKRPNSSHAK